MLIAAACCAQSGSPPMGGAAATGGVVAAVEGAAASGACGTAPSLIDEACCRSRWMSSRALGDCSTARARTLEEFTEAQAEGMPPGIASNTATTPLTVRDCLQLVHAIE